MSARFPQLAVVHALCNTLVRLCNERKRFSAGDLADAVAARFPGMPQPVLWCIAAKVLRLYFEPIEERDIEDSGLDVEERLVCFEFFANAARVEIESLRGESS